MHLTPEFEKKFKIYAGLALGLFGLGLCSLLGVSHGGHYAEMQDSIWRGVAIAIPVAIGLGIAWSFSNNK